MLIVSLNSMVVTKMCCYVQVLIFSQWTTILDILQLYMEMRDWRFARLDGTMAFQEREVEVMLTLHLNYNLLLVVAKSECVPSDRKPVHHLFNLARISPILCYSLLCNRPTVKPGIPDVKFVTIDGEILRQNGDHSYSISKSSRRDENLLQNVLVV